VYIAEACDIGLKIYK